MTTADHKANGNDGGEQQSSTKKQRKNSKQNSSTVAASTTSTDPATSAKTTDTLATPASVAAGIPAAHSALAADFPATGAVNNKGLGITVGTTETRKRQFGCSAER